MARTQESVRKLALFASGTGSNVRNIHAWSLTRPDVTVALIVSNRPEARVVEFAKSERLPVLLISREEMANPDALIHQLQDAGIDLIVLAGFLWRIPDALVSAYPKKMINLHPSLLPKYGGKGMYGEHVHAAVLANHEKESGITIHYVNEAYDEGQVIFQAVCPVWQDDTPETLAMRIHHLEHQWLPLIIEKLLFHSP